MAVQERYGEGRGRLMPAGLVADATGSLLVYPVDKGSGATTSLVDADGFVDVPPGTDYLAEGEAVDVTLFSPAVRPPTLLAWARTTRALAPARPRGRRRGISRSAPARACDGSTTASPTSPSSRGRPPMTTTRPTLAAGSANGGCRWS